MYIYFLFIFFFPSSSYSTLPLIPPFFFPSYTSMAVSVIPGEISTFTVAIAIFSGCILFFGYVSMFLKERLFLSEACKNITDILFIQLFLCTYFFKKVVAVLFGVLAGPLVANGLDPHTWRDYHEITKQLTRCIIAVQVMAVGIELPQ